MPISAKDYYDEANSTGICGANYFMGSQMIGVAYCKGCTEKQFDEKRHVCCRRPALCASPTNETCNQYHTQIQCTGNPGCVSLPNGIVNETTKRIITCTAKYSFDSMTWSSYLSPDPLDLLSKYYRKKQHEIYKNYGYKLARMFSGTFTTL